jgi:outer membrane lipase/esterase
MLNPFARAARRSVLMTARISAVALTAFLIASCGSDDADTPRLFSTTVVIGSSLSDTGNACPTAATPGCPPVPPYASGRISNGTLYIETVAGRYGAAVSPSTRGGNNYAYAGARTGSIPGLTTQSTIPSMLAQLQTFIERPTSAAQLNAQTLFVVEAGGAFFNNFQAGLPLIQAGTITTTQFVTAAVTDVVTVLTRLYSAGARNILLISAPNFGGTPGVRALGTAAAGAGTQLAAGFNQALAGQVTLLVANSPGLKLYTLDAFALFNEVQGDPASFGLTNATDPCVTTVVCATPDTYMFWDGVHPTRAMGAIVATRIGTLLPAP